MISQAPWGIYCFHGKIQVTQDLKLLLFFGGEFWVTRETNPLKHSVHHTALTPRKEVPVLFSLVLCPITARSRADHLPFLGGAVAPIYTSRNPHLDLLLCIK